MNFNNTDTIPNGHSEANEMMKELNGIIAQRNELQQILIQRDITIELLRSKGNKLDTRSMETVLISKMELDKETAENANEQSHSFGACKRNSSIVHLPQANMKYKQMRLECDLLKDLNNSLKNENDNLKIVNKILQNNFDILNERLEQVQTEHQSSLVQLHDANQTLKKSYEGGTTKKRRRSTKCDSRNLSPKSASQESQSKRRRRVKSSRSSDPNIDARNDVVNNGTEDESSVNDSRRDWDEIGESDHMEDNDEDTEDDVIFVEPDPIHFVSIDLVDSDVDDYCESGKENVKVDHPKGDDEVTDDDTFVGPHSIKPLSQYQIITELAEPTAQKSSIQHKTIFNMEDQEENTPQS